MSPHHSLSQKVSKTRITGLWVTSCIRRLGSWAYLLLAFLTTVVLITVPAVDALLKSAESRLFDTLISHRFTVPPADPNIVILDIDEASLAAMAPTHGRWPWANAVFGDMVEALEAAGAQTIVFDVLFSDWDVLRPQSDAQFNTSIAGSRNSFFPMLRLDQRNDGLSKIPVGSVPGAQAVGEQADPQATIALILPKVPSAIDNGRLGTHQVVPDRDGVIRRYPLWTEHRGWRLPSLPYAVAHRMNGPLANEPEDILLNWRGPPFTYRYVPFENAYRAMVLKDGTQPPDFSGKLVVIGATAPSLFDVKGTPVARIHPGVEILATAIDNIANADWLHERSRWAMVLSAVVLVWAMAFALFFHVGIEKFDGYFAALQIGLVGLAYAVLNASHWYIDVSAPLSIGLAYFTVARIYYTYSHSLLSSPDTQRLEPQGKGQVLMAVMALQLQDATRKELRRLKGLVDQLVGRSALGAGRVVQWAVDAGPIEQALSGTVLIYWFRPLEDVEWIRESSHMEKRIRAVFADAETPDRVHCHKNSSPVAWQSSHQRQRLSYGIIVSALSGLASSKPKGADT